MEADRINNKYPFLLWLTSILLSAIYLGIFWYEDNGNESLQWVALYFVFGIGYSLPVFIVFFISFLLLTKRLSSSLLLKVLLDIIVIIGIFITFGIMKGSMEFTTSLIYSASVVLSSTFFRIHKKRTTPQTDTL